MGTTSEKNEFLKQALWNPQKTGIAVPSTGSSPLHPYTLSPMSFHSFPLILCPASSPPQPPFLFSCPTLTSEVGAGDPSAKGCSSLPGACCSLLFSFPCNSRGQVRCASKHCNHILNGNEMCELNVNYSRMEGQSLLVKV